MEKISEIQKICLRRAIVFPTAEIYGGISGFFDYGEIGKKIKDKIIAELKKFFKEENFIEIEGSIILPKEVFKASGHLDSFVDPIVKCKNCNSYFRADHLIEEKLKIKVEGKSIEEIDRIIKENKIKCPNCNSELENVKEFNLMFKLTVGAENEAYLRPETAQNIFIDFKRIYFGYGAKLPFAIMQVGYSFRNEISPRQFLIRLRAFTQFEIEMFFDPKNENCPIEKYLDVELPILTREAQRKNSEEIKWIKVRELLENKIIKSKWQAYFLAKEFIFFTQVLKIDKNKLRFRHVLEEETPFYSAGNFDLEYYFDDFGWKEIVGNAYRTDYDLKVHMQHSKEDLKVENIIAHVAEPSFGIDRIFLALLNEHFKIDRKYFAFPYKLAPYYVAVFPLVSNKEEIVKKAREVYEMLRKEFFDDVIYDEGFIGKLYAKADEIGIPLCITIDYQTLNDNSVTIRFRDTKEQIRVSISELINKIKEIIFSN